ncbi:Nif3-like dinuclear metal center hexameric protein [Tengunoibacter tsumagoiensis]|uniref:GTP cyclohydrolase 1 type 2 homolog n=1 Tax=Tengunoibacter tsumagoiensis TaxID=2014871 RepID=A0A402A6Q5_9CHLR|nr:Nif3-like dinuclear metal center hexameric protein [Tengunoibacter tsumagoiensis]GCE14823.1 hypothetical protein KTT_46820 [Tengunoibacter tsumagoiensis]
MGRTIQDVIDRIISAVPGAPQEDSVDTLKSGDPQQEVTGIVTTFTATMGVLRRAVELNANLIITHEPTFYDHHDCTDWLQNDSVYQAKRDFIARHNLALWRFHDYWHMYQPDGIITGMVKALGWEAYRQPEPSALLIIPGMTVAQVVATVKERLALPTLRVVGSPEQSCERIALLMGAWGKEKQFQAFIDWKVDAVICGETVEWATCEYVRDAIALGENKSLVIVGHAKSEEEGMHYLVEWLQPQLPNIPLTYLAVGDPVTTL